MPMKINNRNSLTVALALGAIGNHGVTAWEDTCKPFHEIYANGKEICENMFGDAFKYETNEDAAFTMWWFEAGNPNDATTVAKGDLVPSTCNLQYFHKADVSPEDPTTFTECHPWQEASCCHEATVTTPVALNEGYGEGYEWDRCGKMSQACERFFVQEACFYECDANAGNYRLCTDAQVEAAADDESDPCHGNTWQMYKMPIKASYCDAWYDACYEDSFCAAEGGDFFSCAEYYHETNSDDVKEKEVLSEGMATLIAVLGVLVVFISCFLCFLYAREKAGSPLFMPLTEKELNNKVEEAHANEQL